MRKLLKYSSTNFIKIAMIGKKGISPMIAIVLLIAFTVAVGGILSLWLTTLTSTQTTTTGSAAEKQILCARSVLTIDEVRYNDAGDAANITYRYTYGTEALSDLNFFFIDESRNTYNRSFATLMTMGPGDSNTTSIVLTGMSGSLQEVRLVAKCQSTYPVSSTCKSGQGCMNKV